MQRTEAWHNCTLDMGHHATIRTEKDPKFQTVDDGVMRSLQTYRRSDGI